MEIFFSIIAGIFAIAASVFGVRNRINSTKSRTRGDIRGERGRLDDIVSDNKQLERDKERVEELDARDTDKLRECSRIGERLRKREQEADTTK